MTAKLSPLSAPIKSRARQPGPQLKMHEGANKDHAWRPEHQTAAASKRAQPLTAESEAAINAFNRALVKRGASPVLGRSAKYYVPDTFKGAFASCRPGCDPMTGEPWA